MSRISTNLKDAAESVVSYCLQHNCIKSCAGSEIRFSQKLSDPSQTLTTQKPILQSSYKSSITLEAFAHLPTTDNLLVSPRKVCYESTSAAARNT